MGIGALSLFIAIPFESLRRPWSSYSAPSTSISSPASKDFPAPARPSRGCPSRSIRAAKAPIRHSHRRARVRRRGSSAPSDATRSPPLHSPSWMRPGSISTYVARVEQATGCATILVSATGENMIVSVPGANASADPGCIPDALLTRGSTVSLQHELPAAANQALIERARRNGSRVVLNASPWRPLALDTLRAVDYLIVNELEAAALATRLRLASLAA